jgi:hypothetical protein
VTPQQRAHYEQCVARGTSHQLAEMFALGQPPQSKTDKEFLSNWGANGSQFEDNPEQGDFYAAEARRQGIDITGAVYLSGLANFPGDPRAWVRGRGDAKKLCEERGWGCSGDVNVRPAPVLCQQHGVALGEDIIESEIDTILEDVPEQERHLVDMEDLREQVIANRGPHWAQNG